MADQSKGHDMPRKDQYLIATSERSYYAEISAEALVAQSKVIEQLINVAFDNLGAERLEVRVVEREDGSNSNVPRC